MNYFYLRLTFLIFCFSTFTNSGISQVQEREPNNTFATADTINILSEKSGTVQSSSDPDDYFKTILPADGTLKIYIRGTNIGTGYAYLALYGYDRRQANGQAFGYYVATSNAAPGASIVDTFTFYGRAADTFYFRFNTSGNFNYTYKYNILDITPNDVEPNNTFNQATPISLSELKQGHVGYAKTCISGGIGCAYIGTDTDYYRAVINTYGRVKITLKANDVYGDPSINTSSQLSLFIFDRRKDNGFLQSLTINTTDGTSKIDSAILNCQGPDTLYFSLYSRYAYGYELSYTTSDTLSVSDEPNNTFATATRIALRDTTKTIIGYQAGGVADDLDYYKTVLPSRGTVKVYVQATSTGGGGYLYAGVYDKRMASGLLSGKYIGGSSSFPAGSTIIDSITINCANTDTLYIGWQSNGCFRYSFRVEHTNRAPFSNFDFTKTGNLYEFTNNSLNATTYKWDFGNSTTSTLPNPPLKSFTPGFYSVKLIANNNSGCNFADTSIKTITIKGIERFTPVTGGNGNLLFTVYGGGLNNSTILKLKRGSVVYTDSGRSVNRYGNIYTSIMDMHNATIGLYDVEIITTDSTYHFPNGFQLQQYRDSLRVEVIGRDIVRSSDTNIYKIRVYNEGNTIAGICEVGMLTPISTRLLLIDSLIKRTDSLSLIADTISENVYVTIQNGLPITGNFRGFIIDKIPQGGYKELSFFVRQELGVQPFYAWVRGPYTGSPDRPYTASCLKSRFKARLSLPLLNLAVDLTPIADCELAQLKFSWATLNAANDALSGPQTGFSPVNSALSYTKTIFNTILQCADEATAAIVPPAAPVVFGISEFADVVLNLYPIGSAIVDAIRDCSPEKRDKYKKIIQSRTSLDPNSLSGPTGFKSSRYINRNKKVITYSVFFENLQTATLPAQRVVVLDTLDGNVFDFKTLKILSLWIGKKSYSVPAENKEFVTDVTIDSSLFVRLNIKLDTLTGILKANFKTIDRATGLATTNPLAGFLPPNVHSPEGQGYFTYSIELKNSVSHGTVINNKASIVFDNNSPILTNTWSNTIDTIRPTSSIVSLTRLTDTTARIVSTGTDANSGLESYRIYGSKNGSPFEWLGNISDTTIFYGQKDSSYAFYILSVDSVGNIENKAAVAEASINFGTLPVTMLPLKATKEATGNRLYWATVTEQNNNGFYIERSNDGRTFKSVNFVPSSTIDGNSSRMLNYSYTDANAQQKAYYRLKQTDKDNRFAFSNVVYIDRGKALNVSVYPNPAKNEIFINSDERLDEILITDLSGKTVKRLLPNATNRYSTADVSNGIYILKLSSNGHSEQVKIIVSR